ncbi:probable serine/threonine-protein kinase DDB_G0282963 isoform X1 [Chenopodium quinoa]|uniref:probable serine/threonine-protein kinase DDB_G0282963 isoform X1 n=2 Tax=Chenopodium quinoa TaxID=63459 RepID=UPI000B799176|nr:probable serine/threonine-protein kinase DDB_G0282963 isoform X1 [Chenopodium quinoa]
MYQTMSPDNLGSSSIRKSNTNNFKSSKEDHQNGGGENGRIANIVTVTTTTTSTSNSLEGNGVIHKSPPKTNQQNENNHHHTNHHHHYAASSSSVVNPSHESSPSRSNACLGGGGSSGDMLLQWGQNKRSRCSRTESRSMVSVVLDKHHTSNNNHVMPPPHPNSIPTLPSLPSTSTSNGSRIGGSTRVRHQGLLYNKDTKNRNLVDQMGTHSALPSRNGGGSSRPISRSTVGKRSPSCTEKNDKKVSSSGAIRKVKSDDSLAPHTSNGNHHVELAHVDHEHGGGGAASMARSPVADTEKGGNEVVEWPRIYLSLSRKEKEDDFYALKGTKLPHRPKKRAKAVDRALQYCFPGLWLSDLTRARYEVRERKSAKKPKRRGLKGLETMESESE